MNPRMSMITLGVDDLARSIEFFMNGLGFPCHGEDENVAFCELNGTWLGLYGRGAVADDAGVSSEGSGFSSFAIAHNIASEKEVELVMNQALSAGAVLIKKLLKVIWGGFSGYFQDPDGHLWEVAHNPFTWIGPKDDADA